MTRASDGIEDELWHDQLGISICFDGRTKQVLSYARNWPLLRTAFYVTDLPTPSWIVETNGLNASIYKAPYWSPNEHYLSYCCVA
jgi:hypothetical protein